ncbi:MAG: PIG-L family deacetylase [Gemmatimonadota bacterium]
MPTIPIRAIRLAALLLLATLDTSPLAGQGSRLPGAIEAGLVLRQVDGVKRVLLVAAHPDDEDTALLATLARGLGVEVAYFSLTRGEGGQNLIGPELGEGLGIIRTGELLAARSVDGAGQLFSRAFDFGYSKTADETFGQWPRELLLSDLVWAIRSFRPQVIVSVFSGTPSDGHGQHQAAGILTREAWDAAGDPTRFAEHFDRGVEPWIPLKLYRRTFFDPENATLEIETGGLDPLLGRSHYQIAMDSRSRHRSQDFGTAQPPGPRQTRLALLATRVPSTDSESMFEGVDTTLVSRARALGEDSRSHVEAYRASIVRARETLTALHPEAILPSLSAAADHLDELISSAGASAETQLVREFTRRRSLISRVMLAATGVRIEFRSRSEMLVPGQTVIIEARVWSGGDAWIETEPPHIEGPPGWQVSPLGPEAEIPLDDTGAFSLFFAQREEASPHGEVARIEAGQMALWRYEVTVSDAPDMTAPYYLARPRKGAMYDWTDDPTTRTRPFQRPVLYGSVSPIVHGVGVSATAPFSGPVRFRGVDKALGEYWRPIQVAPRVSVTAGSAALIWPIGDQEPREVALQLTSIDAAGIAGTIRLEAPDGWRVTPDRIEFDLAGAGSEGRAAFTVTPAAPGAEGEFFLTPMVNTSDGSVAALDVTVIDYPHIEPRIMVGSSAVRVVRFPIQVAARRIGYVMGSGDEGPEAIRQLGLDLELVEPGEWTTARLDRFDTIVLGVRAYEVRQDLIAANPVLLDWVARGGTLITQYNKLAFNDGDYAPYPIEIGRGRVTDENASVRLLAPESAILQGPNEIRDSDFTGWVQERGLYYPSEWDDEYTQLLGMADPDEEEQTSSILVATYGKGLYVHTSLSFFRQLPPGVPGAYRLWANLLSIDARGWRAATGS